MRARESFPKGFFTVRARNMRKKGGGQPICSQTDTNCATGEIHSSGAVYFPFEAGVLFELHLLCLMLAKAKEFSLLLELKTYVVPFGTGAQYKLFFPFSPST